MPRAKQHKAVAEVQLWAKRLWESTVAEFRFHPHRRWAFDLAWPDRLVGFELEGGTWAGGRHTSGAGYQADAEKYSVAAALGWAVIRATPAQVKSGEALDWIEWAMRMRRTLNVRDSSVCHSLYTMSPDSPMTLPGSLTPLQRKKQRRAK